MNTKTMKSWIKAHSLEAFFGLAYLCTWLGSGLYLLASRGSSSQIPGLLSLPGFLLWYFGPLLSALVVWGSNLGRVSFRPMLDSLKVWRVGWFWYGFILFYPLLMHLAVVCGHYLLGGPAPIFFQADGVPAGKVAVVLGGLILYQVLIRGLGEETGWRCYALPELQRRWSPFTASLILGALWSGWHIHPVNFPLLFSGNGIFLLANIFLTTFIYTWVFNRTQGSLLIAVLFHASLNVAEYVVPIGMTDPSLTRHLLQTALVALIVFVLAAGKGFYLGAGENKGEHDGGR